MIKNLSRLSINFAIIILLFNNNNNLILVILQMYMENKQCDHDICTGYLNTNAWVVYQNRSIGIMKVFLLFFDSVL